MSFAVEAHVLARLAAAPVLQDPFAHCVIDEIFPRDFYESIIDHWPQEQDWQPLSETGRVSPGAYSARQVVLMDPGGYVRLDAERRAFWEADVGGWLLGAQFRASVLKKFFIEPQETEAASDALIVSDRTTYAIGPHTDAPHRMVSLLFYLPEDATFRRFGTSLYEPLDPSFRCGGGPHHAFSLFRRVSTLDFVPNRLVAFPKSDRCFHGVERVDLDGIDRRLLIYNVRARSASRTLASTSSQAR
jgi:hypothetical protein